MEWSVVSGVSDTARAVDHFSKAKGICMKLWSAVECCGLPCTCPDFFRMYSFWFPVEAPNASCALCGAEATTNRSSCTPHVASLLPTHCARSVCLARCGGGAEGAFTVFAPPWPHVWCIAAISWPTLVVASCNSFAGIAWTCLPRRPKQTIKVCP